MIETELALAIESHARLLARTNIPLPIETLNRIHTDLMNAAAALRGPVPSHDRFSEE